MQAGSMKLSIEDLHKQVTKLQKILTSVANFRMRILGLGDASGHVTLEAEVIMICIGNKKDDLGSRVRAALESATSQHGTSNLSDEDWKEFSSRCIMKMKQLASRLASKEKKRSASNKLNFKTLQLSCTETQVDFERLIRYNGFTRGLSDDNLLIFLMQMHGCTYKEIADAFHPPKKEKEIEIALQKLRKQLVHFEHETKL